ncbi:MFS transporter [Saccharothrix violaceirubra]|uniref:MFS family permease n=1 Tax=Saccharothrix violaceirubra TaxID=413306 RepID=A0A7W7WT24_9PSEU|nr:MFS transporter [Saccharothrix violaceirubra]MBB4962644.1 MFS family permease [Saccharothrix violaceirubra]
MANRWVVLAVGTVAQGVNAAVFLGLPALTPQLREHFGLTLPQVGLLLGAVNLGTMVALVPWGVVADRHGERLAMTIGGFGAALFLALTAVGGPVLAGVALVGVGLCGASVNAASGRAVMNWFTTDKRGLAMGVRQAASPLGAALTAAVLPGVAIGAGVPVAFVALAGVTGFVALATAALVREPPGAVRATRAPGLVLADPRLIRLSVASGLLVVPQFTAATLMVVLLVERVGVPVGPAAGLFAAAQVLGGLGRLAVGVWSDAVRDRIGPLRKLAVACAVAFGLCTAAVDAPTWVVCAVFVATTAIAVSWNGVALTAAGELAPPGRSGTAIAMQNGANYLAATVTPPLAAWVADTFGWAVALLLAAVTAIGARLLLGRASTAGQGPPRRTSRSRHARKTA